MMLTDFLKKLKDKKKGVEGVYTEGYYTLGGLISGMIIADLWDKLDLPGNKKKVESGFLNADKIEKSAYDEDKLYMNIIAGLVIALELAGVKGAAASGTGMLIGFNYINTTKEGGYLGGLPTP